MLESELSPRFHKSLYLLDIRGIITFLKGLVKYKAKSEIATQSRWSTSFRGMLFAQSRENTDKILLNFSSARLPACARFSRNCAQFSKWRQQERCARLSHDRNWGWWQNHLKFYYAEVARYLTVLVPGIHPCKSWRNLAQAGSRAEQERSSVLCVFLRGLHKDILRKY